MTQVQEPFLFHSKQRPTETLEPLPKTPPKSPQEIKYLTVSELTSQIRGVLEPPFFQVWVQGEVSNCKPATSGHLYFSLKDQSACIAVAAFGWGLKRKNFHLKDGLQVLCKGKISVYLPRGNYQLIVESIEPVGVGALQLAFEQLKTKLSQEGLFDLSKKKSLPFFPTRIAIITSPSGAAIQDMLNILKRRAPQVQITIVPALVQGELAPMQLIEGIEIANRQKLGEIIVLARGGGSIEDLWCFNHEDLARAIRNSSIPIISAVGHEIDFTIADFVADLRAPTPSAAAEILSGHWVDSLRRLQEYQSRLQNMITRELATRKTLLSYIVARLINPKDRLREQAQRCDELFLRLERAWKVQLESRKRILEQWMGKLDALSPLRVLKRGFTLVKDEENNVVKNASQLKNGQKLKLTFYDGQKTVQVLQ